MISFFKRLLAAIFGPKQQPDNAISPHEPVVKPEMPIAPHAAWGAPWVLVDIELLGKYENDPAMAKVVVPEWEAEGYDPKEYNSLIGKSRAWCMLKVNQMLRKVGLKGAKNAGAKRASEIGRKCPFWFGCILPIKHVDSGGRHVAFFLYWINESAKLAATLDGNKGNRFAVNATYLSGRPGADTLVDGPRWPAGRPDGQFVSMAEVLAKYPMFKVTNNGKGTT